MLAGFSGRSCSAPCVRRHSSTVPFLRSPRRRPLCRSSQQDPVNRQELMQALESAVAKEDYVAAAQLKRQLEELTDQDPMLTLQKQLQQAVDEERYQDAAKLRDRLQELEVAGRPLDPDLSGLRGLATSSNTVTEGVRVQVQSYYMPQNSVPEQGRFFFLYKVVITNEGSRTVMLKSRHWVITDGTGRVDEVRGPGVVGEQPLLEPGKSMSYESACPLNTTFGAMEGEYQMDVMDAESGDWGEKLEVKIGIFGLNKDAGPTASY